MGVFTLFQQLLSFVMTKSVDYGLGKIAGVFAVILYIVFKVIHSHGNASISQFQKLYHERAQIQHNQIQINQILINSVVELPQTTQKTTSLPAKTQKPDTKSPTTEILKIHDSKGTDDWMQQLISQQQQKQNLGVLEEEAKLRRKSHNKIQLEKTAHQNWLRDNGAIILAESLGWKNKMRKPPASLDTCAEHQQNCYIDDELNEKRWNRIGLAVFHYNRAPPFTDWMMNYWKKKDRFIGTMKNFKNLTHDWKIHDFPWALLAFESPQFHKSNLNFENYFIKRGLYNFTMTYRLDSDIPNPFGTVWMVKINYKNAILKNLQIQREKSNFADLEVETRYETVKNADPHELFKITPSRKIVQEKTKGVLVVVSNCDSKYRNSLLHLLSKHIKWPDGSPAIDMYGKCGERYDPNKRQRNTKKLSTDDFEKMLPEYRFYFAIENSRCTDYITEKFWRTLLNEVVPIAGGPAREDYEKLIDGDAFLHVADESDIYKTIAVVNKLLVDDLSYNEFFGWRNRDGPFGYKYGTFKEHTTRF